MRILRCDVCKKEVQYETMVNASVGLYSKADFCKDCGSSVVKLLKKHKFLKEELKLKEI